MLHHPGVMSLDLVELTLRHAGPGPTSVTIVPGLSILRTDVTRSRLPSVLKSSLCFIVQGAKDVTVGASTYRYRSREFLFASVELPITGEVIEATPQKPYLCLALEIDPGLVLELTTAGCAPAASTPPAGSATPGIFVGKTEPLMTGAFHRLVRCLDDPMEARVLGPSIVREIVYRVLTGPYGEAVRDLGVAGSQVRRIAKVIERIKRDYQKPLPMDVLARVAGMSLSAFHAHFRRVTALSPLQYQKQLRLQEARRRLLARGAGAADVAFEVGYASPSQFSREYAALFGLPPMEDVKRASARSLPRASSSAKRHP